MKRRSLRARLTLAYLLLAAVAGAGMLGLILLLVQPVTLSDAVTALPGPPGAPVRTVPPPREIASIGVVTYSSLLRTGIIALLVVMATAAVLGWFTARRALRPVRSITAAARRAADEELNTRIRMDGPGDEIKELADAFDHMLTRLERSFAGQRRFIANAAHELKTPVASQRVITEVAIARPSAAPGTVALGTELLAGLDRQERVLAGLLALAQNAETVCRNDVVDLARLVEDVLREQSGDRIKLRTQLATAKVRGDAVLLEQLVRNLVENAFVHNEPQGWVAVHTDASEAVSSLEIANGGPRIGDTEVDQLFEPFRRSCLDRADPPPGNGLGLSVVRAISEAHDGSVIAEPRNEGGLRIRVGLPAA
ncbi:ATP-binding protein [Amycolatopsis ultiminotia]|uniref:histidine kinase n=1 Tax=Amycolatopsis ultiminotia TaxID=543629 RepID=A0ABP6VUX3_9PSEU